MIMLQGVLQHSSIFVHEICLFICLMPQKLFVIIVPLLIKSVFFKAKLMLVLTHLWDLFCVFCKYLQLINLLRNEYWPSMVPL